MVVTLSRWGNSLGVRIPKDALERTGLRAGDLFEVSVENGAIILSPQTVVPSLDVLLAGITAQNVHAESFDTVAGAESW